MLGVAEAEFAERLTSTEHGSELEPHVLLAVQIEAGFGSEQAYLLFLFCACAPGFRPNPANTKANTIYPIEYGRRGVITYLAFYGFWITLNRTGEPALSAIGSRAKELCH